MYMAVARGQSDKVCSVSVWGSFLGVCSWQETSSSAKVQQQLTRSALEEKRFDKKNTFRRWVSEH